MERPMELMFKAKQTIWRDVLLDILNFAVKVKLMSPESPIKSNIDATTRELILEIDPETKEPKDDTVNVDFPDILEHDIVARVGAVVSAATLNGSSDAGTIPDDQYITELLLRALGEPDSSQVASDLHLAKKQKEEEEEQNKQNEPEPEPIFPPTVDEENPIEPVVEAMRELTKALKGIYEIEQK